MRKLLMVSIFSMILFTVFSYLMRSTKTVWIETRILGLVSFFVLFVAVASGELMKLKSKTAFKIHKPFSIFALFLVFLHFIAAILDKYKWGKSISFVQFLGFSYTDKWLLLLSLGTVAMYLMFLIGLTSQPKVIRFLGPKAWKLIHVFSYLSFFIAYVHAVNLGTDLKVTAWAPYLLLSVQLCLLMVIALLFARIFAAFGLINDRWDSVLTAAFFVVLIVSSMLFVAKYTKSQALLSTEQSAMTLEEKGVSFYESQVQRLTGQVDYLRTEMELMRDGKS